MKKTLLSLALIATTFTFSQVLQSDNFNSLTIGNVGTDFSGSSTGQGSWYTFASNGSAPTTTTNAGNNNFQIVSSGISATNGLQITGPNGNKGARYMWLDGLSTAWASRTPGNDKIEVVYNFFTGAPSTSTNLIGVQLYDSAFSSVLNGYSYDPSTGVLEGLAFLDVSGTQGNYAISLGAGGSDLILNSNTWYRLGFGFDSATGQPYWNIDSGATLSVANTVWVPSSDIYEIDFAVDAQSSNTSSSISIFDNYIVKATNTDTLGEVDFYNNSNSFTIYPNPVSNLLNISNSNNFDIKNISVTDINGRVVKKQSGDLTQINVSDLNAGVYFV
ncbi:MAG: T9SS type A sorting domain-containing protein, partial [Bacteroidia bacterium]